MWRSPTASACSSREANAGRGAIDNIESISRLRYAGSRRDAVLVR
jgi:hypothetical protein